MDDQRDFRRVEFDVNVLFKSEAGQAEAVAAKMTDVSYSGICFITDVPLTVGDKLMLEVDTSRFTTEPLLLGEGEVVRTSSDGGASDDFCTIGVSFTVPDKPVIQRLLQLIQSRKLVDSRRKNSRSANRPKTSGTWL